MNRLHIIQLQSVGPFERVYPTPIGSWWKPYKLKTGKQHNGEDASFVTVWCIVLFNFFRHFLYFKCVTCLQCVYVLHFWNTWFETNSNTEWLEAKLSLHRNYPYVPYRLNIMPGNITRGQYHVWQCPGIKIEHDKKIHSNTGNDLKTCSCGGMISR